MDKVNEIKEARSKEEESFLPYSTYRGERYFPLTGEFIPIGSYVISSDFGYGFVRDVGQDNRGTVYHIIQVEGTEDGFIKVTDPSSLAVCGRC